MAEKKIITVFGATGAQGGSLIRAMLNDPQSEFSPRAVTRNASSEKAEELKSAGVEVVEADLDNPESVERAMHGAYGAFCVTFFWEHMSPEKELAHAKTMAEAARKENVQHVIWSSLEDTRNWVPLDDDRMPTLMEKYKVPHFDAKGEADAYFETLPATILRTSFYWDNLLHFGMGPQRGEDGNLYLTFPLGDAPLPGIAADDIGKSAYQIFKRKDNFVGKVVSIAGGHPTGTEMAEALSQSIGQEVRYQAISPDVYRGLGFPGADDLGNMFQFKHDFAEEYSGARDLEKGRALNPEMKSFQQWAEENREKLQTS